MDFYIDIFSGIGATISGIVFSIFSLIFIFKGEDIIVKIIGIPFLICGLAVLIFGISLIIKGTNTKKNLNDYVNDKLNKNKVEKSEKNFEKVENIVNNIYIFGFLIFWFSFLVMFDIFAIESWTVSGCSMFFFSLIFWAVGVYVLIKNIKRNRSNNLKGYDKDKINSVK